MRDAIYFELRKRIKSDCICILITKMLLVLKYLEFSIKKIRIVFKKSEKIMITNDEALNEIENNYPNIESNPQIINKKLNPKILCSVIVPVYNHEDILEKTLDSIVNQECSYGFEIILVDDGSNERTKKILEKYKKIDNCIVIHQENQGIAGARNTGLNMATGKYVMFIDCDDLIEKDMLQELLERTNEQDYDIVFGGFDLVKEKNNVVINVKKYIYPKELITTGTDEDDIMSMPGFPWGKIYKRELFNDIRFLPGYWYEDSIIQFILYRKCKSFCYVPKVFYHYKWYESNFSKTQNSKANVRGVQRYWMIIKMINISHKIGLPDDETFYITLLRHLGIFYYGNIKDFDEKLCNAMFVVACELLKQYRQEGVKLSYIQKNLETALLNRDYELWCLACNYQ